MGNILGLQYDFEVAVGFCLSFVCGMLLVTGVGYFGLLRWLLSVWICEGCALILSFD